MVHGPVPRSHAHDLPKRVRRLGLQCALSAKTWERRLLIVDSLRPAEPKTVRLLLRLPLLRPLPAMHAAPRQAPPPMPACARARARARASHPPLAPTLPYTCRGPPQKLMLGQVDALLADAPRRSVLLCDSSKTGEDGG